MCRLGRCHLRNKARERLLRDLKMKRILVVPGYFISAAGDDGSLLVSEACSMSRLAEVEAWVTGWGSAAWDSPGVAAVATDVDP